MKLPDYAKAIGISYTTAWRWWKANKLPHPARQTESGSIIVDYLPPVSSAQIKKNRVAIYSRVSSSENKDNLNRQSKRLTEYAVANGYQIVRNVKEIGSGLNDSRKQLEALLQQNDYDILLVEHKDRLARFGTNY
ncbi:MAG: IS607 family transposase, partial [Microcoleus sp.]